MVSYAEVKSYLSKREIPQLFESLMAGLMYHRPENHIHYLQNCLDELKSAGDTKVQWSMFVNNKKRKAKETLPPLTPKKQESVSWSSDSRQSTPLPPISARSRALRSQSMPCNGETLRNTYILYHNPPPVLTPPTVPVIFVIGGLGPKIDNLCEDVVSKLRGLVHISASSMLKTRMIIEGFYRMTSIPACAVVDSVLQAMSMVKSAKALIVAGFPRNRGDIEEYKSRRVRVDEAILVDFEESALRNLLVSEVASGLIKTSEIDYELDKCKQDLISVAEYYDEKELLTVVMGDQNNEDVVGDLVIAIERVLEHGTRHKAAEKAGKVDSNTHVDTKISTNDQEPKRSESKTVEVKTGEAVDIRELEDDLGKNEKLTINANEDDVFSAEITHEIEGDITDSDNLVVPQKSEDLIEVLSQNLDAGDKVEAVSMRSELENNDNSQCSESKNDIDLSPSNDDNKSASEVAKVVDNESDTIDIDSQTQEEAVADSQTQEAEVDFQIQEEIVVDSQTQGAVDSQAEVLAEVEIAEEEVANSQTEEIADLQTEEVADSQAEETADPQTEEASESQVEEAGESQVEEADESQVEEAAESQVEKAVESQVEEAAESQIEETAESQVKDEADSQSEEVVDFQDEEVVDSQAQDIGDSQSEEVTGAQAEVIADSQTEEIADAQTEEIADAQTEEIADSHPLENIDPTEKDIDANPSEADASHSSSEVKSSDQENEVQADASTKENEISYQQIDDELLTSQANEIDKESDSQQTAGDNMVAKEETADDLEETTTTAPNAEDTNPEVQDVAEETPIAGNESNTIDSEETHKSDVNEGIEQIASPSDYGTMDEAKDDDDKFIADFDSMQTQDTEIVEGSNESDAAQKEANPDSVQDDEFDENGVINIDIKITQTLPDPSEGSTATASPVSMETALLLPRKTEADPKPLPIAFTLTGVRIQKTTLRNMLEDSGINLISFEDITKAHFHPMDFDQALHLLKSTMLWERTLVSKLFLVTEFPWELMGHNNIDDISSLGDVSFITDDGPKNTGPESEEEEPSIENDAKTICDSMISVYFNDQLKTVSNSDDTSESIFQILKDLISEKDQDHGDENLKSDKTCDNESSIHESNEVETLSQENESINEETVVDIPSDNKTDKNKTTDVETADEENTLEGTEEDQVEDNDGNPNGHSSHEFSDPSHHDDSTSQILSDDHVLAHDDDDPSTQNDERGPSTLIRQGTFCAADKDDDSVNLDFIAEINQNLLENPANIDARSKPDESDQHEAASLKITDGNDEILSDDATTFKSIPSLQKDDNNAEIESNTIPDAEIPDHSDAPINANSEEVAEHNETLVDNENEKAPSSGEVDMENTNGEDGDESTVLAKITKTPDEDYDDNDDSENSECKFDTDQSENDAGDAADPPKTETDKYFSTSSENNLDDQARVLEVTAEVYAVDSTDSELDTILSNKDSKTHDQDEAVDAENSSEGVDDNNDEEQIAEALEQGGEAIDIASREEPALDTNGVNSENPIEVNAESNIDEALTNGLDVSDNEQESTSKSTKSNNNKNRDNPTDNDEVASENAKNKITFHLNEDNSKITSETDIICRTEQTNRQFSAKSRQSGGQDRNEDNEERERSSSSSRGEL